MNTKREELVLYLLETVKGTIDFAKDQAPIVVKEMLVYDTWEAGLWFAVPAFCIAQFFLLGAPAVFVQEKTKNSVMRDWMPWIFGPSILVLMVGIFAFPTIGIKSYFKIKKIETAPKYYLIEKITKKD